MIDLWVEAWEAAMPQIDFKARRAWLEEHLDRLEAGGAVVLLAEASGEASGWLTVDPTGLIDQLVVAMRFQKQGVAKSLLAAAERRSGPVLRLTVNTDNPHALAFYRKQGFAPVGTGLNARSGLPVVHLERVGESGQLRTQA
jgi:putative acetyltransferase